MAAESKIRRNPQVVYRRLVGDEGGVLLHLETGQYHGVNEIGALVWELLDGERRLEDILAEVESRVDGAPPTLHDEVTLFLSQLRERNLVTE
jgi:hypothetical protein